jgi:starch phosphorylase
MKFALNGALTIGTLDGANVEILQHVGEDNIVIFGMTAEEVSNLRRDGHNPRAIIEQSPELSQALSSIASGVFSPDDSNRYASLIDGLYNSDWFMVTADFEAYAQAQRDVEAIWSEPSQWFQKTILNTARMGWFSSDRTIRQYAEEIWRA